MKQHYVWLIRETARAWPPCLSETNADKRDLLARETDDVRAAEAVALFCVPVKNGLFVRGGIGENTPIICSRICAGLRFLGIELEEKCNAAKEGTIEAKGVSVRQTCADFTISETC